MFCVSIFLSCISFVYFTTYDAFLIHLLLIIQETGIKALAQFGNINSQLTSAEIVSTTQRYYIDSGN